MAFESFEPPPPPPPPPPPIDRQARLQLATDELLISLIAKRLPRTLVPRMLLEVALAYVAVTQGALGWLCVRIPIAGVLELHRRWVLRHLERWERDSPKACLNQISRFFAASGLGMAVCLPFLFVPSDMEGRLEVTAVVFPLIAYAALDSAAVIEAFVGFALLPGLVLAAAWASTGSIPGALGAVSALVLLAWSIRAVRAHRRMIEELVRLTDENKELAESASQDRDRAQAASLAKTRFFASASHDLRQPLHALSINATTLELLARRSCDPLLRDLSQGIHSALRQSRRLLDGLLDISRLDAHAVRIKPVALRLDSVLHAVRVEYLAAAQQRGLSLELVTAAESPFVMTDGDQLMRILGNLVDNAIKFTPTGSIVLSAQPREDSHVLVRVTDTGVGIAYEEQERVFEEFYQVGNSSRDRDHGLGLGLAIVRRTAQLLSIDLRLLSEQGRGTVFELRIPAATRPEATDAPDSDAPASVTTCNPIKVLVVDDETEILTSMLSYLRELGWPAQGAAGSKEAMVLIAGGFEPDVAVVDYRLREETGEVAAIRLRTWRPGLPVLLVTGDTSPKRLGELGGLGIDVLHKPLDGEQLRLALVRVVKH